MTHETDAISTLIANIDSILYKASSRRPWLRSVDVQEQRRLLEQVRTYLVSQQQLGAGDEARHQEYQPQATARQIVQAVEQDMEAVRTSLMHSLQGDLESLRQQRESLVLEIRQMESYRLHHRTLAQQQAAQQQLISEFLQVLSSRLQETLTQQMAQTLRNLETQFLSAEVLPPEGQKQPYNFSPSYSDAISSNSLPLHPRERLEQLQTLQAKSDQLLATLDSTIRTVFEALQRNLVSYQESLAQGLDKMHNLGQQSEVMFTELVNQLTEQFQQEASAILQSSRQSQVDASSASPTATTPGIGALQLPYPQREPQTLDQPSSPPSNRNEFNFSPNDVPVARQPLPYPGVELPLRSVEQEQPQSPQFNLPTDRLGESVQRQASSKDNLFGTASSASTPSNPTSGAQSSGLEDLNLENLGNLEMASLDDDDMKTIFQTEPILPTIPDRKRDEIDDFFESLFGTPPLPQNPEQQAQKVEKQPENNPAGDTQTQSESINPIIPQDSAGERNPRPYSSQDSLEDALFAGLEDPAEDAAIAQPPARVEQVEDSWENVLFPEDWEKTVIQVEKWAIAPTIARDEQNVETNEAFNPETVEEGDLVISALTDLLQEDLFQEQEVLPAESPLALVTPPSVEEITQIQNTQIQDTQIQETQIQDTEQPATEEAASLEEDIYIPASPDENLLAMDTFSVDQDEFFWLDRDTLQLLSEDLSSFEAPQGGVFPQSEEQRSHREADFSDNATEIQTQDDWFAEEEELFGTEIPEGTVDAVETQAEASEVTQGKRHQEALPVTELDELLMEDWDDLALDSFVEEDSVPGTDGESERLPSGEFSLDSETENAIAHHPQNSHQEQPETANTTTADERADWNLASLFPVEPLDPAPDKAIAFLPPANLDESSEVLPSLGSTLEAELGIQEDREYIADSQQQTLEITSTETPEEMPETIDFDESLVFPEEVDLELPTETAGLEHEYVADWEWEEMPPPANPSREAPAAIDFDESLVFSEEEVDLELPPIETAALEQEYVADWESEESANPPREAPAAIDFDESLSFFPEEVNLLPTETAALEQEYFSDSEAQQTPEITGEKTAVSIEFDESWELFADEEQSLETPRERAIASDADIDALTGLQEEDLGDWEFEEMPEISQVEITHLGESDWQEELLRLEELIAPPDDAIAQFPNNPPMATEEEAVSEPTLPQTDDFDLELDIFSDSSNPEKKTP
ncbi:hypothetical protein [Coleofasciculus sp. FACHB-542]|uniref:hypothetical protein n=1 Tax=Coleofasciculus sp. FACHB-542 TaxID=2692787 RepID=UPI001686D2DC|nr:hypothetical protein [Coleofasciculus sp. FACHB-542]MBD2086738.1 hypothetical protein [Coleofasciculus sp. FACHB-542]